MPFTDREYSFVERSRVGRLATITPENEPHLVPICFAIVAERIVSPIDVKPKQVDPLELQRVKNIESHPTASLLVDRYSSDWSNLGWVRVDGDAAIRTPDWSGHEGAIRALSRKYDQYADHPIERRPLLTLQAHRVASWGNLASPQ